MEHTQNYQLSQWSKDDYIRMEDFNGDNDKIDKALAGLAAAADAAEKMAWDHAYYLGQLALRDYLTQKRVFMGQRGMFVDPFLNADAMECPDNVRSSQGYLTVTNGKTATVVFPDCSLSRSGWTKARLWIHRMARGESTIKATLNGQEMERTRVETGVFSPAIIESQLWEFQWTGQGTDTVQLTLDLDPAGGTSMELYDLVLCVL